jgi:hypothetical protein
LQDRAGGGNNEDADAALGLLQAIARPTQEDHFMRAELMRYNRFENDMANIQAAILGDIIQHYMAAAADNTVPMDIPRIFVINRLEDFVPLMQGLGPAVEQARAQDIATRQQEAVANTDTKIDALHEYFENATTYTNDRQSVHDSKANDDLRKSLRAIQKEVDVTAMITEAHMYLNGNAPATAALAKMAEGNHIGTLGTTEDRVFALVWARSHAPGNDPEDIRNAIRLALEDCWENGHLVCINGRCGRVIGALVGIDVNPEINVMTTEAYRNQIYQECIKLIDATLAEAKQTEEMRVAADAYYDDVEPEPEQAARLRDRLRKRIDILVDSYTNFTIDERQRLKEECYIAAIL